MTDNFKKLSCTELVGAIAAAACGLDSILTDASECAASVKAAKNLAVIGSRLSLASHTVARGDLVKNGIVVAEASVSLSGLITVNGDVVELPESEHEDYTFVIRDPEAEKAYRMPVIFYPALMIDDTNQFVLEDINNLLDLVLGI